MDVSISQGGAGVKLGDGGERGLRFFWHDDPEDQVNESARKCSEDGDQGVENPHEGGVPAEPFGQTATDAADHFVGGEGESHKVCYSSHGRVSRGSDLAVSLFLPRAESGNESWERGC